MTELSLPIKTQPTSTPDQVLEWVGRVLTNFAIAEQAIGSLCADLHLTTHSGPLSSIDQLKERLLKPQSRKCKALLRRIERWHSLRLLRHLLAHCTVKNLYDQDGNLIVVTRTLPRDKNSITPDRMWTPEERVELLRVVTQDGRSIADHVRNLMADPAMIKSLRES